MDFLRSVMIAASGDVRLRMDAPRDRLVAAVMARL